jgi:putative cardiolipin synthase
MRSRHQSPILYRLFLGLAVCALFLSGCATLPIDYPRKASTAFDRPEQTNICRNVSSLCKEHPEKSGFYVLNSGLDAFLARAALIGAAEKTLDLQYYIVHFDLTGKLLLGHLLKAADRGVRVRILVDGMYIKGKGLDIASYSAHPNIDVRIFNPYSGRSVFARIHDYITDFSRIQRRMHNKMFIADAAIAVVGGRNLGDEYFAAHEDVNFGDVDILAVGPVVRECGEDFDRFWNSDLAFPIEALVPVPRTEADLKDISTVLLSHMEAQRESLYEKRLNNTYFIKRLRERNLPFVWASSKLVYDMPEKIKSHGRPQDSITLWPMLSPYFKELKSELILISPYFVPGKKGLAALKDLRNRGIRVRILTNSLAANDVSLVHGGYSRYRKEMLRSGIELYEVRPNPDQKRGPENREIFGSAGASLHAKSIVFDRKVFFVGSANLDPRSRYLNTEVGIVAESPELAEMFASRFDINAKPEVSFRVELEKADPSDTDPSGLTGRLIWIGEEEGEEVIYNDEPFAGFWQKLSTKILSFFAPESML